MLATIVNGQKLLISGSSDGWLYALQPRTGKIVWEYQLSRRGLNVARRPSTTTSSISGTAKRTPPARTCGAVAAIKADRNGQRHRRRGELWKEMEIGVGKSSILKVDDRLYALTIRARCCVMDAKTGKPIGRPVPLGTINFASPVSADGKIYHVEKNGRWYILTPDEKEGVAGFERRGKTNGHVPRPATNAGPRPSFRTAGSIC